MMSVNTKLLFAKARQLQQAGELSEAIDCFEQLLSLEPKHVETLRFLGLAYAQLGKMQKAIDCFSKALEQQPEDTHLHNNLANAYKNRQLLDKAIHHYQSALALDPHYAQAHNNLATIYASQNQYQQALRHYHLAVNAEPDFAAAHYNLGLLFLKNNQLDAAKKQFNNVLTLNPKHLGAEFYLGVLCLDAHELDKAELAFREVLAIDSEHVQSLINLGVIALKRDQGQLAVDYFTKALGFDSQNLEARNNLAATFMHHDRFENALMHYDVLVQHDPRNIEYLYNMGVAQMALGHLQEAMGHFNTLLGIQQDHFAALNNLAAIHVRLGKREEAIRLLKQAIKANPEDKATSFMLHALTGSEKQPKPSPEYISNLFNNYALYYEQHMKGSLHYTLPQQIARVLHKLHCLKVKSTLDLGCGTGLTGIVLRELSEHLIGVDISAKMLEQAEAKRLYDQLFEDELTRFLQQDKRKYDLVVAADVLPYLGELETLFTAVYSHLKKKGLFVFTHEISKNEEWQLQETARFSHHPDYIKAICEKLGFSLIIQEPIVARQQNEEALEVMLSVAKKESLSPYQPPVTDF